MGMRKYLLLISIIILIIYYISTFLISFTLIAKSVVNNDHVSLARYINIKELRSNFYDDIYKFSLNLINLMDKNIKIKSESIELEGELTMFTMFPDYENPHYTKSEIVQILSDIQKTDKNQFYLKIYKNQLGDPVWVDSSRKKKTKTRRRRESWSKRIK